MSIGTAIFLSTVLVLAYHLAYHKPECRKVVLWVLGIVAVLAAAFGIWILS